MIPDSKTYIIQNVLKTYWINSKVVWHPTIVILIAWHQHRILLIEPVEKLKEILLEFYFHTYNQLHIIYTKQIDIVATCGRYFIDVQLPDYFSTRLYPTDYMHMLHHLKELPHRETKKNLTA